MKQAFKTELLLSPEQGEKVNQTIGVCRYVYNLYLSTAQNYYKETGNHLSGYDFSKWLNNVHTKERIYGLKTYPVKRLNSPL